MYVRDRCLFRVAPADVGPGRVGAVLCSSTSALATPIVTVPATTSGGASSFAVTLSSTAAEQIAGYTFSFTTTPRTGAVGGVTFTGDWATEAPNALFPGQNPSQGGPSSGVYFATDSLTAGSATASDGKGIVLVNYGVTAGTSGVFDITINRSGPLTSKLLNSSSAEIAATYVSGTITVTPEPAGLALVGLSLVAGLGRRPRSGADPLGHEALRTRQAPPQHSPLALTQLPQSQPPDFFVVAGNVDPGSPCCASRPAS